MTANDYFQLPTKNREQIKITKVSHLISALSPISNGKPSLSQTEPTLRKRTGRLFIS